MNAKSKVITLDTGQKTLDGTALFVAAIWDLADLIEKHAGLLIGLCCPETSKSFFAQSLAHHFLEHFCLAM